MSESKNSSSTTWLTILTLVVIPLAVAVIYNWEKIFPPETTIQPQSGSASNGAVEFPPTDSKPYSKPKALETAKIDLPDPDGAIINDEATGTVVDQNGQPVIGVKVRCTDCLTDNATTTTEGGFFRLPFRVKKKDDQQQIHLSVSGYEHPFPIRANAPQNQWLTLQ